MKPLVPLLACILLVGLAGCQSRQDDWIPRGTDEMARVDAFRSDRLAGLRRVAVLPVWGDQRVRENEREVVTVALLRSLQQANRFEVVSVSTDELRQRYSTTGFSASSRLPADLFEWIADETGAEAALFVEVTSISSYPPLALGLKGRIEPLDGGSTLWAFDHFFNANDPSVALAARRHNAAGDPNRGSIQLSPSLFADFVTTTMVETLSEREKR